MKGYALGFPLWVRSASATRMPFMQLASGSTSFGSVEVAPGGRTVLESAVMLQLHACFVLERIGALQGLRQHAESLVFVALAGAPVQLDLASLASVESLADRRGMWARVE